MKYFKPQKKSTSIFNRSLRIAKISIFFMFLGVGILSAASSYSQNTKFNLKISNKPIKDVFSEIEKSSEYIFFYNNEAVDVNKKVSVSVSDGTIDQVLHKILDNEAATYEISDRQVIIYKENKKREGLETKAVQQTKFQVTGKIVDESGEALIGVSVVEKGTSNGAISDFNGNYSLMVNNKNGILTFTYIGFDVLERSINGKSEIDVVLRTKAEDLDAVVVVAYGTQRKSSITGSISTVDSDVLKSVTSPNVSSMLQGAVAGVAVTQLTGKPGEVANITIRGRGSISSSTTPLWVVDGIVGGLTSDLNPNDIESLTVLKDGSATALYGSRGANGVIVVTTKSAKMGANRIDLSIKTGIANATRGSFRVMNSSELYEYTEAAFNNSTGGTTYSWFTPALLENNTDWWDIATQTAFSQNYNLAYTTGNEKLKSFLSGDYFKEEGVVKGYDYERFTVRNNLSYKVTDRLTIRTKVSGSYTDTYSQERDMYSTLTYLPWDTPENTLGEIKTGKEGTDISTGKDMKDYWFGRDANNYLYDLQYNWSKSRKLGVDGTFGLEYKILDGLTFESTNNIGYNYYMSESYTDPRSQSGKSTNGSIYNYQNYITNRYANQLLRYAKIFNTVHDLSAFLGFEYNDSYTKTNSVTGTNIPIGGEVLGVATTPFAMTGDQYTWKALGYYFNVNYAFSNKYLAQFSIRRDGSSKFGRDNRFGNFFTIGGGWNIQNEAFMKPIKAINELKLRASYGSTGNTPSAAFAHMGLYQINLNYNTQPAAFPFQMANRNMSWEKAYTTNIGIDALLFDRLGVSTEFYIKNTSGLLYSATLSALTGYNSRWLNEGAMKNTGVEVTLSPQIIKSQDWNWTVDFNFAYNKNEITELAGNKESEVSGNTIRQVGYALGTYYMKEWAGVNPLDGTPLWFAVDDDGNKSLVSSEAEATLTRLDKRQLPDLTGGIMTNLSYRDFTLSASFAFASGFYIYHSGRQNYDNDGIEIQYNSMKLKKGWVRWEKPGDVATHPQVKSGGNNLSNTVSSRYLERGDFFKMRSLSIAYNVPMKVLNTFRLKSANVSFSGENLFTITEFSGVDPELGANGAAVGAGYSVPRRFSVGINLGF